MTPFWLIVLAIILACYTYYRLFLKDVFVVVVKTNDCVEESIKKIIE